MSGFRPTGGLMDLAESLVDFGKACGADEVEVSIVDGYEFNVDVRLGKIEDLVEAGSRAMGLRIIKDKKTAFASSSDMSRATLRRLVRRAVRRAELANPDPFSGLAPLTPLTIDIPSLELYDPEVPRLDSKTKIALALEAERIALRDARITNSYGAGFVTHEASTILVNSNGFRGEYDQTYCGLSLGLQAGGTDDRVEDFWSSSKRFFKDLATPKEVADKAVARTVRQLNPRKIKTQKVPVIFDPTMTSWLLVFLFSCVAGTAIYQKASFLADKLGERIGDEKVTVVDGGLLPRELGTRPFDADGLPSRKTLVMDKGILTHYLCNTYAARKLNCEATGNSSGAGVSPNNFYLEPGTASAEDIIRSTEKGLLLIRTLGHGLNPVTGDISRGAFGMWIEGGEIAYPVSEITVSGNLGEVLRDIETVGRDIEFLSPVAGPTVKIREMTVAGT
ncbi:MAG: TldD/PmbA family protein [Acidobacteriota bacterium]|nr:TldD/PmbA family protein [Acidobacteriota bacterium]